MELQNISQAACGERFEAGPKTRSGSCFRDGEGNGIAHGLAPSEQRFRALAMQSPVGVVETDCVGNCFFTNECWLLMSGLGAESTLMSDWMQVFHPEDRGGLVNRWRRALQEGLEFSSECRIQRPDGTVKWVKIKAMPIRDESGGISGCLATAMDISEGKRMEKEFIEIHDSEQQRICQELHDGVCQHLVATSFACRLLENKFAESRLPELLEVRAVGDLIDEAIVQIRALARGLCTIHLDDGLIPALRTLACNMEKLFLTPCRVECNQAVRLNDLKTAMHLYRIVQEAATNAMKHAKPKCVAIGLRHEGDTLFVTIADDGDGLGEDSVSNGMGIQIMKHRAHLIGASLEIRSGPDRGTEVACAVRLTGNGKKET